MAATSYAQLKKQIAMLEIQAAKLKTAELSGVVAKLRETIAMHGLTADDLFGSSRGKPARGSGTAGAKSAKPAKAAKAAKGATANIAKYSNGEGGTWGGRGKRPQWLRDALSAGRKMEEFIQPGDKPAAPAAEDKPAAKPAAKPVAKKGGKVKRSGKAAKKMAGPPKYSDGAGNSWSGMGPKPKWFQDAIAAGKTPEELSPPAPAAA